MMILLCAVPRSKPINTTKPSSIQIEADPKPANATVIKVRDILAKNPWRVIDKNFFGTHNEANLVFQNTTGDRLTFNFSLYGAHGHDMLVRGDVVNFSVDPTMKIDDFHTVEQLLKSHIEHQGSTEESR